MTYERLHTDHLELKKELQSAQFVQQGLLPKKRHFDRLFREHFTLYIPQYLVSGDFYWVGQHHNLKYLVVGDCTGHGVSASLLSVLALNLFEYVIMNKEIKKTNKILKELDKKFISCFKDASKVNFDNPWIDLAIVCVDTERKKIFYSTANRKIMFVNQDGMKLCKGSSYPIGGWQIEKNRKFESASLSYQEGDMIFMGSDGFQDQFGGPKDKKYSSKRLHQFLSANSELDMNSLKQKAEKEFYKWKGDNSQIDDVCMVGIRL